ncbi:MAG: ANTAR domain-containing response regulator [Gammaproteobacteria bacterium]
MKNNQTKRRILVVDDDLMFVQFATEVLQHGGYDTLTAHSGEEALALIGTAEPDFAMLDIKMRGMSGLELASVLRQQHPELPFMFVSALNDERTARRAAQYGGVGYLIKPVDGPSVLSALASALARADEIRQLRRSEANLNAALASKRDISLAVGMLMGKFSTNRDTAFETLREHARATRQKVDEAASVLLLAEETVNNLNPAGGLDGRAGKETLPGR